MYFATVNSANGKLIRMQMTPTRIRRFKINRAAGADAAWLMDMLNREGTTSGTRVKMDRDNRLVLHWK